MYSTESSLDTSLKSVLCSLILQVMDTILDMSLAWSSLHSSKQSISVVSRWLIHSQQWSGLDRAQLEKRLNLSHIILTAKT